MSTFRRENYFGLADGPPELGDCVVPVTVIIPFRSVLDTFLRYLPTRKLMKLLIGVLSVRTD